MKVIEHPAKDIPERTFFDQRTNEFVRIPAMHLEPIRLQLEHSLMSMRRYEAETHRPFSSAEGLSQEELLIYIKCMTINPQKSDEVYKQLTPNDLLEIAQYIQDPRSAWEIREIPGPKKPARRNRPNTVESIYYAMIQYGIDWEAEKWHLNSLMALIDYCYRQGGTTGGGGKSKSQKEMNQFYHAMNMANRKKYNSKG